MPALTLAAALSFALKTHFSPGPWSAINKGYLSLLIIPLIFRPVCGCCTLQMLAKIYFHTFFLQKKCLKKEKARKLKQNWAKKVCAQMLVKGCIKPLTSVWKQPQNTFFGKFCLSFLAFLTLLQGYFKVTLGLSIWGIIGLDYPVRRPTG